MRTTLHHIALLFFLLAGANLHAQESAEEKAAKNDKYYYTREGNRRYEKQQYDKAEELYNKANRQDPNSFAAIFNKGDALYKQGKFEEAQRQFEILAQRSSTSDTMALVHHNVGNTLLQQKKYQESIDAYKKALRLNPGDDEARYNLAYAQKKLKEEQKKQQEQKDRQKEEQNKEKNKDPKKQQEDEQKKQQEEEQKKKDELEKKKQELQQEQQQLKQDKKENQQKQKDQRTGPQERQQLEQQNAQIDRRLEQIRQQIEAIERQLRELRGQPEPKDELSKEEARRILEALKSEEERTRDKLDKKRRATVSPDTEKDW